MRPPVIGTLLVIAAGLTGCGGDDEDGGGGLSREAYIAKADAICEEANKRETESGVPAGGQEIEDPRVQRSMVAGPISENSRSPKATRPRWRISSRP